MNNLLKLHIKPIKINIMSESDSFEEYDVEYDDDDDSVVYSSEENSKTRYNIILCELYNEVLHGETNDMLLKTSYLVYCRFKNLDMDYIDDFTEDFNAYYLSMINDNHKSVDNHSIFRNYKNIISRENYIKPEIAECKYLENNECVAILKTFWIKIIQRVWKNIIKTRKDVIKKRININAINVRELTGKWPISCRHYPELKGMLTSIKSNNFIY